MLAGIRYRIVGRSNHTAGRSQERRVLKEEVIRAVDRHLVLPGRYRVIALVIEQALGAGIRVRHKKIQVPHRAGLQGGIQGVAVPFGGIAHQQRIAVFRQYLIIGTAGIEVTGVRAVETLHLLVIQRDHIIITLHNRIDILYKEAFECEVGIEREWQPVIGSNRRFPYLREFEIFVERSQ